MSTPEPTPSTQPTPDQSVSELTNTTKYTPRQVRKLLLQARAEGKAWNKIGRAGTEGNTYTMVTSQPSYPERPVASAAAVAPSAFAPRVRKQ